MLSEIEKPTQCDKCGADSQKIEFKQMMTFEYWYCHACGEEVELNVGVDFGKELPTEELDLSPLYQSTKTYQSSQSSITSQPNSPQKPNVLSTEIDFFNLVRWMASQWGLNIESEASHKSSSSYHTQFEFKLKGNILQNNLTFDVDLENRIKNLINPALSYSGLMATPISTPDPNNPGGMYTSGIYISFQVPKLFQTPSLTSQNTSSPKVLTPTLRELINFNCEFAHKRGYTPIAHNASTALQVFEYTLDVGPTLFDPSQIKRDYISELRPRLPSHVQLYSVSVDTGVGGVETLKLICELYFHNRSTINSIIK